MGDLLLAHFKIEQTCTKKLCIIIIIMYKALLISLTNYGMQTNVSSRLKNNGSLIGPLISRLSLIR